MTGDVRDISRFPGRDHFAACNGTAPAEVSSGNRVICRLSLRGNRRLNHAIHMAAVTQIRYKHSPGRACYDKKIASSRSRLRQVLAGMTGVLVVQAGQAPAGDRATCPGGW